MSMKGAPKNRQCSIERPVKVEFWICFSLFLLSSREEDCGRNCYKHNATDYEYVNEEWSLFWLRRAKPRRL